MSEEKTSLLGNKAEPKPFYFLDRTDRAKSIADKGQGDVEIVNSSSMSRQPSANAAMHAATARNTAEGSSSNNNGGWLGNLFGTSSSNSYQAVETQQQSQAKPRKVPVKIEPKVFFANERTFLAWLHMSVTLASISVAIVAFAEANAWSQVYGLLLMPVAVAFCAYSLWMYMKRAAMIRRKDPGPYEDKTGPIVLAAMLGVAIVVNFAVKLYDYST